MPRMILTGDVNLMHVDDAAVPFARVCDEFRATDVVFSNLECCLYDPPGGHAVENEGFFAPPQIGGEALRSAGISAVGIANNVNYGEAAIVASCHWGLHKDVLGYMPEIAHAAIDAGADLVIGHGPHYSLPVEVYRGKAIFYGLGSFSFHTGHGGRKHGDWVGMMVRADIAGGDITRLGLQFVRQNERNETMPCRLADERAEFNDISTRSAPYGTRFIEQGDELLIVF